MRKLTRLATPFQRLQWRLTLSYTLVTTGALLVVELLFFGLFFYFITSDILPNLVAQAIRTELVPAAQPYLAQTPPDVPGLQAWADSLVDTQTRFSPSTGVQETTSLRLGPLRLNETEQQFYVLAPDLTLLVQAHNSVSSNGENWQTTELAYDTAVLQSALRGNEVITKTEDGTQVVATPILSEEGAVLGILMLIFRYPLASDEFLTPILQTLFVSLIPITLATGLIGTLFGFLTARGLTRRIRRVATAADAWSQGDFSVVAQDNSGDELGELSRRLNRMAEQLQNLLETRQELAASEARNQVARDLHDAVKQQIFATTMQLATARSLLEKEPASAAQHLAEAEQLAQQAQRELTGLIRELRPRALENQGLAAALRGYAADWSRQTLMGAVVRVQGERPLPLPIEQTFFRVAQESLANVARHSHATQVEIHLAMAETAVTLTIHDDGQGFTPDAASSGLGLHSMQERMADLGGSLRVDSVPGKGTTITAAAPISIQVPGTG